MNDFNEITLIGRLTKNSEFKKADSGKSVLNFTLANNYNNEASFFDCVCFGKFAETMKTYLLKGKQILVSGRLVQKKYEVEGKQRTKMQIFVADIQMLSRDELKGPESFADACPF